MSRKLNQRECVLCTVGLTILLFLVSGGANGSMRETVDGVLSGRNLQKDEASLLGYLKNGLPPDGRIDFNRRWQAYGAVSTKLAELGSLRAVPLLIERIESPLPAVLEEDLIRGSIGHTTEAWDRYFDRNLAQFRATCAMALARLGDSRAIPVLLRYMQALEGRVSLELKRERPEVAFLGHYALVAKAVTALGDKTGIDAMVSALDRLPDKGPELLIQRLQMCTKQLYGPKWTLPRERWAEDTEKWKTWWSEHRANFVIGRDFILDGRISDLPRPEPTTLREQLMAADTRHMDFDNTGYGKRASEWLEKHCGSYTQEIAAIINDRNEGASIRKEALAWYIVALDTGSNSSAGNAALALLSEYAVGDKVYTESGPDRLLMQNASLRLIEKHFPDAIADVLAQRLYNGDQDALQRMDDKQAVPYILEHFTELSGEVQRHATYRMLQLDAPVSPMFFFEALKSKDDSTAGYAAQGIKKFNLESALPQDSRESLARWREDPAFLLGNVNYTDNSEAEWIAAAMKALSLIEGTDAPAARNYLRVLQSLPVDELSASLDGLTQCVRAYQKHRSLSYNSSVSAE